jgi:hypothetical protein
MHYLWSAIVLASVAVAMPGDAPPSPEITKAPERRPDDTRLKLNRRQRDEVCYSDTDHAE